MFLKCKACKNGSILLVTWYYLYYMCFVASCIRVKYCRCANHITLAVVSTSLAFSFTSTPTHLEHLRTYIRTLILELSFLCVIVFVDAKVTNSSLSSLSSLPPFLHVCNFHCENGQSRVLRKAVLSPSRPRWLCNSRGGRRNLRFWPKVLQSPPGDAHPHSTSTTTTTVRTTTCNTADPWYSRQPLK